MNVMEMGKKAFQYPNDGVHEWKICFNQNWPNMVLIYFNVQITDVGAVSEP